MYFLLILCSVKIAISHADWTSVTTALMIPYDLERNPLQIKTNTTVESNEDVRVHLYTADDKHIGYIKLSLSSKPQYDISSCLSGYTDIPVELPADQDKTWTISKTAAAIRITCNEVLVVYMQYYDSYSEDCVVDWNTDVEKIFFEFGDTASDWYREKPAANPPATCTKPTIENGSVSPSNATIKEGNSYNASCSDDYTLYGCDIIECYDDGTLSRIPTCTYCCSGWTSFTTSVYIAYDLEGSPLQIKTNSMVGRSERVRVDLYTADMEYIGYIDLSFNSVSTPPKYLISSCYWSTNIPVDLPADQEKIWTISKTATAIRITCNDVEVVNMQYYRYNHFHSLDCVATWSKDVETIWFHSDYNNASDWYRERPGSPTATCSKPTIENGGVSPSTNTIETGEFYNVSCSDGYTLYGHDIIECYYDGNVSTIPNCTYCCSDWASVTRDVYITYDLEVSQLQIKTDSVLGSNEKVEVKLYTADAEYIGTFQLAFYTRLYYSISSCHSGYITVDLPADQDTTWTISKTEIAMYITCNDVLKIRIQYHNYTDSCELAWHKDVEKIYFSSSDAASDLYRKKVVQQYECYQYTDEDHNQIADGSNRQTLCERHDGYVYTKGDGALAPGCGICQCCKPASGPADTCTGLPDIDDLVTTQQFPVDYGTEITVSCTTGSTLQGDDTITCIKDTTYSFDSQPSCVADTCTGLPDIDDLVTTQEFPVDYGTEITVSCITGSTLQDDDTITCTNGATYSFDNQPSCVAGNGKSTTSTTTIWVVSFIAVVASILAVILSGYILYLRRTDSGNSNRNMNQREDENIEVHQNI